MCRTVSFSKMKSIKRSLFDVKFRFYGEDFRHCVKQRFSLMGHNRETLLE